MTMIDRKCEVCGGPDPVAVVATALLLSVAMCRACIDIEAQPEIVFVCWKDSGLRAEEIGGTTYKFDTYLTYAEWLETAP